MLLRNSSGSPASFELVRNTPVAAPAPAGEIGFDGAKELHPVVVCTPREKLFAAIELPATMRLSSWLGIGDQPIAMVVQRDMTTRSALVNRAHIDAIIDDEAPSGDPTMVRSGRHERVSVVFESGLRIEGDLLVPPQSRWQQVAELGMSQPGFRALTTVIVAYPDQVPSRHAAALVNLSRAVEVAASIPTPPRP